MTEEERLEVARKALEKLECEQAMVYVVTADSDGEINSTIVRRDCTPEVAAYSVCHLGGLIADQLGTSRREIEEPAAN